MFVNFQSCYKLVDVAMQLVNEVTILYYILYVVLKVGKVSDRNC